MIQTIGSSARALGRTRNGWTQSPRTWERQFAEEEYAHTEALLVLAQAIEEARRTHCCPIAYPGGREYAAHEGSVAPEVRAQRRSPSGRPAHAADSCPSKPAKRTNVLSPPQPSHYTGPPVLSGRRDGTEYPAGYREWIFPSAGRGMTNGAHPGTRMGRHCSTTCSLILAGCHSIVDPLSYLEFVN